MWTSSVPTTLNLQPPPQTQTVNSGIEFMQCKKFCVTICAPGPFLFSFFFALTLFDHSKISYHQIQGNADSWPENWIILSRPVGILANSHSHRFHSAQEHGFVRTCPFWVNLCRPIDNCLAKGAKHISCETVQYNDSTWFLRNWVSLPYVGLGFGRNLGKCAPLEAPLWGGKLSPVLIQCGFDFYFKIWDSQLWKDTQINVQHTSGSEIFCSPSESPANCTFFSILQNLSWLWQHANYSEWTHQILVGALQDNSNSRLSSHHDHSQRSHRQPNTTRPVWQRLVWGTRRVLGSRVRHPLRCDVPHPWRLKSLGPDQR